MKYSLDQLTSALEQRNQHGRPLNFFLRDDDVDDDEASLRTLLQICLQHSTPINLAAIPGRLTSAGTLFLNNFRQQHPGLIELTQHGWMHVNHESKGKKCEFGVSRNFAEQLADLIAGQTRMNEAFGPNWFPAFVPPWNRCTPTTVAALDELGFQALSRDHSQPFFTGCKVLELPITLDLYRWRNGAEVRPPEELIHELSEQVRDQDRIGIMLHHKVMDEDAFTFLANLLPVLTQFSVVQFHTFQHLFRLNR